MKSDKKILVAFLLNLVFSIFEFIGGTITGSVAILSDAIHDIGDAASIGTAYFLERKSMKQPDDSHTYGYARYSVLGGLITTVILLVGSLTVIYHAVMRLINPTPINYDGMILMAVFGVVVNLGAAWFTREGDSLNQKAVNLHMLEDVLGWVVVLIGAIVMRFTDFYVIDPILSIGVAAFILFNAVGNLKEVLHLILVKTPEGVKVQQIRKQLAQIDGVIDVHHIHIWSMDGHSHYATMHIVTDGDGETVKKQVKQALKARGIGHATLELERPGEDCGEEHCRVEHAAGGHHHHHHHHHHHGHKHQHDHHEHGCCGHEHHEHDHHEHGCCGHEHHEHDHHEHGCCDHDHKHHEHHH